MADGRMLRRAAPAAARGFAAKRFCQGMRVGVSRRPSRVQRHFAGALHRRRRRSDDRVLAASGSGVQFEVELRRRSCFMSEKFDVVIIGGGIVGLATAMALTERLRGKRLVVLEKESQVAAHQSSHNSGVIHSGLYYKPGSLKAKMCVAGAAEIVAFCEAKGVPFQRCGQVVVATSEAELPQL